MFAGEEKQFSRLRLAHNFTIFQFFSFFTSSGWVAWAYGRSLTVHRLFTLPLTIPAITSEANGRRHWSHHDNWWTDRCWSYSTSFYCTNCPKSLARLLATHCSCRVWWSHRTCRRRTELFRPTGCKRLQLSVPSVLSHLAHLSALESEQRDL